MSAAIKNETKANNNRLSQILNIPGRLSEKDAMITITLIGIGKLIFVQKHFRRPNYFDVIS